MAKSKKVHEFTLWSSALKMLAYIYISAYLDIFLWTIFS